MTRTDILLEVNKVRESKDFDRTMKLVDILHSKLERVYTCVLFPMEKVTIENTPVERITIKIGKVLRKVLEK